MVTNKAKETACYKHADYLVLVFRLGGGVMLTTQIQAYAKHFWNIDKGAVRIALKELQDAQVIDMHKVQNSSYIKLKKYAIRFIAQKHSSQSVSAVKVGFTALKKSVFVNQLIIYRIMGEYMVDTIDYCSCKTTLIAPKYKCWEPLLPYTHIAEVRAEVENLQQIANLQLKKLRNPEDKSQKVQKLNTYNVNNMQSSNVYILSITEGENKQKRVEIAILDINNNYTAKKIIDHVRNLQDYFKMLFGAIELVCVIYVANVIAQERVRKEILTAYRLAGNSKIDPIGATAIRVRNLELTAQCFNNVEILL